MPHYSFGLNQDNLLMNRLNSSNKILDVEQFKEGLQRNMDRLNRLEKEMAEIQETVRGLVEMEDSLKGHGGEAIRGFYEACHLPFLSYFQLFTKSFYDTLTAMGDALTALESSEKGYIQEEYLMGAVQEGIMTAQNVTEELVDEANAIMQEVADIVALPHLDDTDFQNEIQKAKNFRNHTIDQLFEFDRSQTIALSSVDNDIGMMKAWMENIESFYQKGLTDIGFQSDQWNVISRSSLGMAIVTQQAPVGSVAHALYEQNQLSVMLQAFLSNMTPIRFGLGGYVRKTYPIYGPMMLSLNSVKPGDNIDKSARQVSESADPDLEELYAALAKEAERRGLTSPSKSGTALSLTCRADLSMLSPGFTLFKLREGY